MNIVFVPLFQHAGLTLSVSLGATINALFLYIGLRRKQLYIPQQGIGRFLLRILPALLALAAWLYFSQQYIDWSMQATDSLNYWLSTQMQGIISWSGIPAIVRLICLFGVLLGSLLVYFAVLLACGFRPKDFARQR